MNPKSLYFNLMHRKNRMFLFLDENDNVVGGITYVFTNEPEKVSNRYIWSIPKEDIDGKFIYIDRVTSKRGQNGLRALRKLCQYLWTLYPDKKIVWHSRRTGKLKEIGTHVETFV